MSKENLINKIANLPDSPVKVSGKINSSDIKEILTENAEGYSENDYTDADKAKLDQLNVNRIIFGDRDSAITLFGGDLFNVNKTGFYYATSGALNKPAGTNGYFLVEALSNDYKKITYSNQTSSGVYTIYQNGGQWGQWEKNEVLTSEEKSKLSNLPEHIVSSDNNGNIGVGKTNPTVKLDIDNLGSHDGITLGSFLKLRNSSPSSDAFVMEQTLPTGNLYVRSQSSEPYSGNLILNDIGGNVGIGTNSPQDRLHIKGGRLRIETPTGYGHFGSAHTSFFHFHTDRPIFYFNKEVHAFGDIKVYGTETCLRHSDGAIIQNGEKVATENQIRLKVDKKGLTASTGRASTPINTAGWFKLAEINRGGGFMNISFIGGDYKPTTFHIKYYKDWSSTGYLTVERLGNSSYIKEARIIKDTDDKYYLEIYCSAHEKGLKMDVYDQPLLGLYGVTVFVNELLPGTSSGSPISHAYFIKGVSNPADQYIGGRLGIGLHNPSEKLEVFDSNTKPAVISLKSHRVDSQFVDVGQIVAKQDTTEVAKISMPRAGGTFTGFLSFWTKENNSLALVESMRIDEKGRVGIGTTDPGVGYAPDSERKLMVNGGITVKKGSRISYDPNYMVHAYTEFNNSLPEAKFANYGYYGYRWDTRHGTDMVMLGNNGNVGMGTTDPKEDLTIYNNSARLAVTGASGSSAILLGNQDSGGVDNPAVIYGANGTLYFGGGTSWDRGGTLSTIMQVNDNGRVGIGLGTGAPQRQFHLKGGQMRVESSTGFADIGSFNADYFHFSTNSPAFYFNKQTYFNGDIKVYGQNTYLRYSDGAIIQNGKKVATEDQVNLKVTAVAGKGLSANDFTNAEKLKLQNLESGAVGPKGDKGDTGATGPQGPGNIDMVQAVTKEVLILSEELKRARLLDENILDGVIANLQSIMDA